MREGETTVITSLEKMLSHEIDMLTTVIIGNSETFIDDEKMVTPRGERFGLEDCPSSVIGL